MEAVKQWAMNICITLVVTGIFSMLIPQGSMEKVIKFAISVFFLSCVLVPFITGLPELEFTSEAMSYDISKTESLMQEQFKQLSGVKIEQAVRSVLKQEEITPEKVETNLHISEDNSISISKITVWLREADSWTALRAAEVIKKETGIEAEVITDSDSR